VKIKTLNQKDLPLNWHEYTNYSVIQKIGDQWIEDNKFAVLKIPSSIIKREYNYLINPSHKDFKFIKLLEIEDFEFNPRIKAE